MTKKLPKSITREEFVKLVKHTKSKRAKITFLLAYGSGMRVSEVINIKAEHITNNRILIEDGKGGKDRIVPLPKGWKQYMFQYLPINRTSRSLQRNFKIAAAKANLNPLYSFHSLRHGFATNCVERGIPLNQVQLLLGHSNLATTSIYTKARPESALKSYEELF